MVQMCVHRVKHQIEGMKLNLKKLDLGGLGGSPVQEALAYE